VKLGAALVAALAFLSVLVAACGGGNDLDIDISEVDVEALLVSAADRMDEVGSFRFDLEHENGTATIVRGLEMVSAEGDVEGADRMQLKVDAQAGPLNAEIEIIVLPDEGWITNPLTGRWERETIDVASFFDPAAGVTGLMRSIENGEVTRAQKIGGFDAYLVEAEVSSETLTLFGDPKDGEPIELRAWIGIDDPVVHRIEAVGGIVSGEPDDLIRRLTFTDFGQTFGIKAPR
jgi:LppX_LprAFG lipoprotein